MPDPSRDRYFDTVTLSNFVLAQRLDVLIARYGTRAKVTREVLDEVSDGLVAGYTALAELERAVTSRQLGTAAPLTPDERDLYRQLIRRLAPGEASCIACAKLRGGIVVTDDRAARQCCAEQGVHFTGTIGILKACCMDKTLSLPDADTILEAMIAAGYHSPVYRISDLL